MKLNLNFVVLSCERRLVSIIELVLATVDDIIADHNQARRRREIFSKYIVFEESS